MNTAWQVRREWVVEEGRRLRQRTCEGCDLEQQLRFVFKDMTWALFRQSDIKRGPVFGRRRRVQEIRVINSSGSGP
jgi:hypothetical protein